MDYFYFIIDFIINIDQHLNEILSKYGMYFYLIVFLIIFCETGLVVMPLLPGDSLLFLSGALAANPANNLNINLLVILLIIAAVLGDAVNYILGKFFGKKAFSNPNSKIFKQEYLQKTHNFYEKYGGKTIIIARFMPFIRTFAPFVAGMSKMHYRQFGFYNITGGIIWISLFLYAGYFFGELSFVQENIKLLILAIILISISPAIFGVIRAKIRSK